MRVWLNGEVVDVDEARIHPFDRGFLYGDGVYETIRYFAGTGVGMDQHTRRLELSLSDAKITGFDVDQLDQIGGALLDDLGTGDGLFYLQVSRGVQMPRRHLPGDGVSPTVFGYASPMGSLAELTKPGVSSCVLLPDQRWSRCSIKGTSLMANVLASMECDERGGDEAILHRDGFVSEGSMTNVFAVVGDGLITPPVGGLPSILVGVTRRQVLAAAATCGMECVERPLSIDELAGASEVVISSSRRLLDAVVRLDGQPVGNGSPGPTTLRLFGLLREAVAAECSIDLH